MIEFPADLPGDADGDVLRRMQGHGFDFSKPYSIDFIVDFAAWPPSGQAVSLLQAKYPRVMVYEPDADGDGYVLFQIHSTVSYKLVTETQAEASALMVPFGGVCEAWGVLQA